MNNTKQLHTEPRKEPFIKGYSTEPYAGIDFKSPDEITEAQNELLRAHIGYVAANSPFYKRLFKEAGIEAGKVKTIKDLSALPFTTKEDILTHNEDFISCSKEDVADVCMTSATTGDTPSVLLQSFSDLSRLAHNEEKAFSMMGITSADTVAVCAAIDRCFMAGLAYYIGGLKVGARMVRAGAGSAAQHWRTIKTTGSTVVIGVPSLMRKIARYALECGDTPEKSGVRMLVAIGESIRGADFESLASAKTTETLWGAPLYSTYASTEMATAFCECSERRGGHLSAELVTIEIIDDNGKVVPNGTAGELVVTPLGVTGMPLVRFRTGDVSFIDDTPCKCGRNTPRLGPVLGRKNQMLKFKGTTVYPSAIISAAEALEDISGAFVEVSKDPDGTDAVRLYITPVNGKTPSGDSVKEHLRACVRVVPEIVVINEEQYNARVVNPDKRKKTTFFDLR